MLLENDDRYELSKENTVLEIAHISMLQFCKNLYHDINDNIESWSAWMPEFHIDSQEDLQQAIDSVKSEIRKRLDRLHAFIVEREDDFGENRCFF